MCDHYGGMAMTTNPPVRAALLRAVPLGVHRPVRTAARGADDRHPQGRRLRHSHPPRLGAHHSGRRRRQRRPDQARARTGQGHQRRRQRHPGPVPARRGPARRALAARPPRGRRHRRAPIRGRRHRAHSPHPTHGYRRAADATWGDSATRSRPPRLGRASGMPRPAEKSSDNVTPSSRCTRS